ncbi:MAG: hypothetical protein SGI86_19415 [Deltaproteobacteria bacterium]|mgnify:CR=1 FL=1|nr:hypothetical protein [Deltaproteobacteria bacterium]
MTEHSATSAPVSPRLEGRARQLLLQAVAECRTAWRSTGEIMARFTRQNRSLPASLRRRVLEDVYGMIRMDRRIEAIADSLVARRRGPKREMAPEERDAVRLAVYELLTGGTSEAGLAELSRALGPGFSARPEWVLDPDAGMQRVSGSARLGITHSFPTWMVERLQSDLGEPLTEKVLESLNSRAPVCLLTNTSRIDRDALIARLALDGVIARPSPLSPLGLQLQGHANVFGFAAFEEGLFDVMDEGSQLVAALVDAQPEMHVLDACAGAGGKTLAMAITMQGRGRILAMDTAAKKLEELRTRVRRMGFSNVVARPINQSGAQLPDEARPGVWDRVLVDAPCTALGTLRRHPELRYVVEPETVRAASNQQLGLLATYAPMVAPGGRLIYATCTLFSEENETVVERFLRDRNDYEPVGIARVLGDALATKLGGEPTLRLYPHLHGTDGFFATVLQRKA